MSPTWPTPCGYSPVNPNGAHQAAGPPARAATASASSSSRPAEAATRTPGRAWDQNRATTPVAAASATGSASIAHPEGQVGSQNR
jgi:hypothetical protein